MLDGVEDPYHFGQAVRSLYAAGANGVLVRARNWTTAATVIARASAGASERITMSMVDDLDPMIDRMREDRIGIVCADARGARSMHDVDLTRPLLLVVGGSRRGISRRLTAAADTRIRVPYDRTFGASLDITSATAAIAFEIARQRSSACSTPA